ncbi:saccharopine dehydrogenase family protein [Streptomyces sp. NPDC059456]|uniref:saccharopine dehydrogenase family protein n=1 Tax=Streptomyces sp. NPDC059456 TaxID=3346838 RepID=UPI0036CA717A
MKVALLGCGQMGRAAAYALATDPGTEELLLLDRDPGQAAALRDWLQDGGGTGNRPAATVRAATGLDSALGGCEVVAMAMPWAPTGEALHAAVGAGRPVAAITRPPTAELSLLDTRIRSAGGTVLLPVGLEPGLTELLAVHLAQRLDRVHSLEIYCGGIPTEPREPIGYTAFFGGENDHHLPIAQREALALDGGRPVHHPRFSGVVTREYAGVGQLEAYHDGMAPWLGEHPALRDADCTQKTLRWPGFARVVTELARLGLLADDPVDVDGSRVIPRRLVERVLSPQVRATADDRDAVVLDLTAHGELEGRPASLRTTVVDIADEATGLSAMARTTGFTLAAATRLLAERAVTGTGWIKPHLALSQELTERVMQSLTGRGVTWLPAHEVAEAERPHL